MTSEISDKLLELTQFCALNHIEVTYLSYGATRNVIEETVIHGVRFVQIELGKPEDENLLTELTDFLDKLKE